MIPFDPDDVIKLAGWLSLPTPDVPAVRIECADEEAWLAARVGTIGASEIGVIMGVSSWASPYALWYRKKLDWRLPRTERMRWGHLVEDPIAELFAEEAAGWLFVAKPVGAPWSLWCHPVRQWMTCTPDRLAVDRDGRVYPVEIKSDEGGKDWGEPGTDEVPEHHRLQSMWQSHIFGSGGGYVVRRRGSGKGRLAIYWVPYDANIGADMIDAAGAFLDSIKNDEPPEPDASKSSTETLKEINPAIDPGSTVEVSAQLYVDWMSARATKRDAAAAEARESNALRAEMGRAEFASVGGHAFAKRRMGKRAGYEVPPGTTDQLVEVGSGERPQAGDLPGPEPSDLGEGDDLRGGDGVDSGPVVDAAAGFPDLDPEATPPSEEEGEPPAGSDQEGSEVDEIR